MQLSGINESLQYMHDREDAFNAITDMITIHDMEFNIVYANKAAVKTLGLPSAPTAGMKCFKYYHGSDAPPVRCPSCRSLQTKEPATYEMFEPNLKKFLEIRTMPRLDNDKRLVGLIHIVRDITDRKKMVEERLNLETQLLHSQKLQTVGTLTGNAVHDFNNFLTAIIGYSELLQSDVEKCNPEASFYAEQIINSAKRASTLTNDLLAFSRKRTINPQLLNINETVRQVMRLLSVIISRNIELDTSLAGDDLMVVADVCQVEQILMNLAVNARDAMPAGGVLSIKTGLVELDGDFSRSHGYGKPGNYVLISVSDSGTGMDESTRERIFEPFFTTKETGKGTGLGLAIVYGIIKQYSGYIRVKSEPGNGTTFEIYLPATRSGAEAPKPVTALAPAVNAGTVLVLEGSTEVRGLITDLLEGSGYEVIEALNADIALERLIASGCDIDILITDRMMHRGKGDDAYKKLLEMKPGIGVLFTNGYANDNGDRRSKCGPGIDVISRPFLPRDLLKTVEKMIKKKGTAL